MKLHECIILLSLSLSVSLSLQEQKFHHRKGKSDCEDTNNIWQNWK